MARAGATAESCEMEHLCRRDLLLGETTVVLFLVARVFMLLAQERCRPA